MLGQPLSMAQRKGSARVAPFSGNQEPLVRVQAQTLPCSVPSLLWPECPHLQNIGVCG